MTARLAVDLARCRGHGMCMLVFAERVDLDPWGFPIVDRSEIGTKELLRRARRAVAACPRGALSLQNSTSEDGPIGERSQGTG